MTAKSSLAAGAVIAALLVALGAPRADDEGDLFRQVAREAQPAVAAMMGLPEGTPVEVAMMTRQDLEAFLISTVKIEYPNGELTALGRCCAEVGLVPRGYDLTAGTIDLIREEAGAVYDPYSKSLKGLLGLPPMLRSLPAQKLIVSHEICHALEDRVIDIKAKSKLALDDVDYSYAVRATIEGMATVVMLAYFQGLAVDKVPDARAFMRLGFSQREKDPGSKALAGSPRYLRETLFSPYSEGSAFAQAWLRANQDLKLGALLEKMPVSAEQVLHFEKYAEGDQPTAIDLGGVAKAMPGGWSRFHADTFGEFDLLIMFEENEATRDSAAALASGWDGVRFEAFEDSAGLVALVGTSAWDTEADAAEFGKGFRRVVSALHADDEVKVVRDGTWVDFAIGPIDGAAQTRILEALAAARTPAE